MMYDEYPFENEIEENVEKCLKFSNKINRTEDVVNLISKYN
jgi:hypothetical protein